jgi:hypothetical protein
LGGAALKAGASAGAVGGAFAGASAAGGSAGAAGLAGIGALSLGAKVLVFVGAIGAGALVTVGAKKALPLLEGAPAVVATPGPREPAPVRVVAAAPPPLAASPEALASPQPASPPEVTVALADVPRPRRSPEGKPLPEPAPVTAAEEPLQPEPEPVTPPVAPPPPPTAESATSAAEFDLVVEAHFASCDAAMELQTARAARRLLLEQRAEHALFLLSAYQRYCPSGKWSDEAWRVRLSSLCALGRNREAASLFEWFAAEYPARRQAIESELRATCEPSVLDD